MKTRFTIIALLLVTIMSCQEDNQKTKHQIVDWQTSEIFDSLIQIRRDIHQHPELSGHENRTSKIVAEYLSDLGLEVRTGIAGNSVIGILNGKKNGRKIAWRADMDAIKINSADTTHFKSKNEGIGHMCGHDIHTTIGLGIANVLANQREKIDGTVYFIFQSSEETFIGAKELVESNFFDSIGLDEIYALHIGPAEKGTINTKTKELFAYQKTLQVKLKPETNQDEIDQFLKKILQEFVRNNPKGSPSSLDYLDDPKLGLQSRETIYNDYFILQNTRVKRDNDFVYFNANLLETNEEKIDSIPLLIKEKISNSKFKDILISVDYSGGNPTVYNDLELVNSAKQTLDSLYKKETVIPIYGQIPYFNEDFIKYQQKVSGVLFLLGGSNKEKGLIAMPHAPKFVVDEETIKYGVKCFSSLILERTKER